MSTNNNRHAIVHHEREEQLRDGLRFADISLHDFLCHARQRFLAGASVTEVLLEIDLTRVLVTRSLDFVDPAMPTGDVAALLLSLSDSPRSHEVH
jgi:hypothetical protein